MLSLVQPEPGFEIEPEQRERAEERGDAELAIGFELGRDAIRLAPFVGRRSNWPSIHDAESRRDQRARAPDGGGATGSASRKAAAYSRAVRFLPRMCQ